MGLDMYIYKKRYIWDDKEKKALKISGIKNINTKNVCEIKEEVGYWRKMNAIHKWFVDNVQEGNDDCKEYYVTIEDLEKLLGVIETILKSKARCVIAEELLPNESGFFFGSTEYDEYYFEDLKETVKGLKTIIKDNTNSGWEFYYNSSW